MKTWNRFCKEAVALLCLLPCQALATFSIVAVDPLAQQVGGAMATCGIYEPQFPSDLLLDPHPGIGIIVTQAGFHFDNQEYARQLMDRGLPPTTIIDSLVSYGCCPGGAQYGVAALQSGGLSASYTGPDTPSYNGHLVGQNYAIQGNILQGAYILEGMEQAFLASKGPLADRLMAALQGANVVGADSRCESLGFSSLTAVLIVANQDDHVGVPSLDLSFFLDVDWRFGKDANEIILRGLTGEEPDPIDGLQTLYGRWKEHTTMVRSDSWGRLKVLFRSLNSY